jgi:hypothetical protein
MINGYNRYALTAILVRICMELNICIQVTRCTGFNVEIIYTAKVLQIPPKDSMTRVSVRTLPRFICRKVSFDRSFS